MTSNYVSNFSLLLGSSLDISTVTSSGGESDQGALKHAILWASKQSNAME